MVLGSVAIETRLDLSGVDKDLDSLKSRKPLKIGVKLDATGLQRDLQQLPSKLDPIKVDLNPDVEDFQRKLQRLGRLSDIKVELTPDAEGFDKKLRGLKIDPIKVDLSPDVEDFQEKLRRVARISPITVEIKTDRSKVQSDFREVGKYAAEGFRQGFGDGSDIGRSIAESVSDGFKRGLGIQSPSRVFKEYGRYSKQGYLHDLKPSSGEIRDIVKGIENEFRVSNIQIDVKINPRFSKTPQNQILDTEKNIGIAKNITDSIEKGFKNVKPKDNIFGSLFKVAGNIALAPIQGAFQGAFGGVGLSLGEKVGNSVLKGIESSFSDIIGSFDLVGEAIGDKIASEVQDVIAASGKSTKVVGFFEGLVGLEKIAAESGTAKQRTKQAQAEKNKLAQKELLEQQRNLPFQSPETLKIPAQIRQTRITLSKQRSELATKLQNTTQKSAVAKEIAQLQKKLNNSLSSSELEQVTRLQQRQKSSEPLSTEESQKLAGLQKKASAPQISEAEIAKLNELRMLMARRIEPIAKQIQAIDQTFIELDEQEAQIKLVTERPIKALAKLGNKSAQEIQKLEQEIQQLKSVKQGILANLSKSADKAGNIPENKRNQATSELKKAQQFIERRQKRVQELRDELIIPEEINNPQEKQQYLNRRNNALISRQINSVRASAKNKTIRIRNLQADKSRTEQLLKKAKEPFDTVGNIEKELVRLQNDYEDGIKAVSQQIEDAVNEAQEALQKIEKIKVLRQSKVSEIQSKIKLGEIPVKQADAELEILFKNTKTLSDGEALKAKSAIERKNKLSQERDVFASETAKKKNAMIDRREAAINYLQTPEAEQALNSIKVYEQWLNQTTSTIEKEVSALKSLNKKEAQLKSKLNTSSKNRKESETKPLSSASSPEKISPTNEQNPYSIVARLVAKKSGIEINESILPKLTAKVLPDGVGGNYDISQNKINLHERLFEEISTGTASKDAINLLVHELRHAIQSAFGKDQNYQSIELLSGTKDEREKLSPMVQASVTGALSELKGHPNAKKYIPAWEKKLLAIEEDAYVFVERHLEEIYGELVKELEKAKTSASNPSIPNLKNIQDKLRLIPTIQSPVAAGNGLEFSSQKDVDQFLRTNLNAKGVKSLASKLGMDTKSASKELLMQEITAQAGAFSTREEIAKIAGSLRSDDYLASSKDKDKVLGKIHDAKEIINELKAARKVLAGALKDALEIEGEDKLKALEQIRQKSDELSAVAGEVKKLGISGEQSKSLVGVRSQLKALGYQSRRGLARESNTNPLQVGIGLRSRNEVSPSVPVELRPQSVDPINRRIQELELDLDKIDTNTEKRIQQIEADIQLRQDAASMGVSLKPSKRKANIKRIKERLQRAELEKIRLDAGAQNVSEDTEQELKEMKRSQPREREKLRFPATTPYPTTLSIDQELGVMRGKDKIPDPDLRTTGLKANNFFRRVVLKFKNSVSKKTQIEVLETVEQVAGVLADIEKGVETAAQVQTISQKVSSSARNAPNYLRERAKNAVFTKSRYLFENSDAINTLVANRANEDPTGKKTAAVQTFNNKRGELAQLLEVYAEAPSKSGFKAIKQTLKEVEDALKEVGVPLPKVNALLGQYEKNIRELQGKGLVPLDIEIPEAEKLPLLVDFFGKFGDAAAKALGPVSAIGPALKGAVAFAATSVLQNFFQNLAQDAFRAYVELDKMRTVLNFASGGSAAGSRNLKFVKQQVDDLKIPLNASIAGFTKLESAARGSALAGKENRELFKGLSQASTVLSLSGDETEGITTALGQSISKGKIFAEEQNQLAERIPGLFGLMSRAAGVTEAEFTRLRDSGQIITQDFLPKFARQLQSEFGDAAVDASGNAQSAIFDFQNSVLGLQQGVGEGIAPAVTTGITVFTGLVKGATAVSNELGFVLLGVSAALAVKMVGALQAVIAQMIATKLATGTLGGGIAALGSTINNSFSAKLSVGIFAILEVVNLLNQAINTELVQSFDKAAKSAERAAKEAEKALDPKKTTEEIKPESSSGVGRTIDFFLKPLAKLDDMTVNKLTGGKTSTWADYEQTRINESVARQIGAAANLISSGKQSLAGISQLAPIEKQLQSEEQKRQVLQANIKRNFSDKGLVVSPEARQELEKQNLLIQQLNEKRTELSKPITLNIARTDQQITSLKAQIESLKTQEGIAAVGGTEQAQSLIDRLNESIKALQNFKAKSEQALGALRVDPVLAFEQALRKLNLALAEGQEFNQLRFNNSRAAINQQQLSGFSDNRFASKDFAIEAAKNELAKNRTDVESLQAAVDAGNRAVNESGFQSVLQKLGVSPNSSIARIDDVLSRTQDDADKAVLERLKGVAEQRLRLSESQASLSEMPLRLKQAEQDKALSLIDEGSNDTKSRITRGQNETLSFYRRGQAKRSISGEEAGVENARIELENTQALKRELDNRLFLTQNYYSEGTVSAEEFERRKRDLSTESTALEKQEAESQLALADAIKAQKIADLEFANRQAEAVLNIERSNATTAAKEKLLAIGMTQTAQDEFNRAEIAADRQVTEGKIANIKKQIEQYQNLYGAGDISLREFQDKQIQLNQELASLNTQLIDHKIKNEENYRAIVERNIQRLMQAEDNRFKDFQSQLNAQKSELDLYNQSLEFTIKLEESRFNLGKAVRDAGTSSLEINRDRANRALELSRKLKDENLDPTVRGEINRQLSGLGFGDSELAILDRRNQIEDEISAKKLASLKLEQEYQRKTEEWRLRQQKITAEIAVYDAQGMQLAAEKAKVDAEGALRLANLKKDDIAIKSAQISIEIASRDAKIAEETLQKKIEILNAQEKLTNEAKEAQEATQQSALDQQVAADAARKQAAALERVETSVSKTVNKLDQSEKPDKKETGSSFSNSAPSDWKNPFDRLTKEESDKWRRERQKKYSLSGQPRMESDFEYAARINELRMTGEIQTTRRTTSGIDSSGFDWGQGAGKMPAGYSQSANGSIYQDYLRRENQVPVMPNSSIQTPAISMMDGLKTAVNSIDGKLADLAASISSVASRPSVLQVSTANPVSDGAKLFSDFSKNAVRESGL